MWEKWSASVQGEMFTWAVHKIIPMRFVHFRKPIWVWVTSGRIHFIDVLSNQCQPNDQRVRLWTFSDYYQCQFGDIFHLLAQMNFYVNIKKINLGTLFTLSEQLTLIYNLLNLTSMFSWNENQSKFLFYEANILFVKGRLITRVLWSNFCEWLIILTKDLSKHLNWAPTYEPS